MGCHRGKTPALPSVVTTWNDTLLLYVLTLILRFIRAYRARPQSADPEEQKIYKARFVFFGFELVNVSAGVFILLSEHAAKYVGTVMMLYVILVILSFFFEDDNVGLKVKVWGHVGVSLVVFVVTFYAFLAVDGLRVKKEAILTPLKPAEVRWRVALPYFDQSLNRNFGVRDTPVRLVFVTPVSASNRDDAIRKATLQFRTESGPRPFSNKAERNASVLMIIETDTTAERGE